MLYGREEPTPTRLDTLLPSSGELGLDLLDIGGEAVIAKHLTDPAGEVVGPGVVPDHFGLTADQLIAEVAQTRRLMTEG